MSAINNTRNKYVGIEASIARFNAVCIGEDGRIANQIDKVFDRNAEVLPQVIAFIDSVQTAFGDFAKVGIAVPGLVNKENGRVEISAHIPEYASVDLIKEIKVATGLDAVLVNDANAAALAENKCGAGLNSKSMFYATLGLGVGGAFVIDGEIWRGSGGFAGEFGYLLVDAEGTRLEEVASTADIVRRTINRFHQDSTSSLNKMDESEITISAIIEAAEQEDDFAILMLERTGSFVGAAIANVINLLNVETIVIDGEIMRAGQTVLDAIKIKAEELSFASAFSGTRIVAGKLGRNAAAIGAAFAIEHP